MVLVTMAEAKTHLRLEIDPDNVDHVQQVEQELTDFINSADSWISKYLDVPLVETPFERVITNDFIYGVWVPLPVRHIVQTSLVIQTWDLTSYPLESPDRTLVLGTDYTIRLLSRSNFMEVVFTLGIIPTLKRVIQITGNANIPVEDIPSAWRLAARQLINEYYQYRDGGKGYGEQTAKRLLAPWVPIGLHN